MSSTVQKENKNCLFCNALLHNDEKAKYAKKHKITKQVLNFCQDCSELKIEQIEELLSDTNSFSTESYNSTNSQEATKEPINDNRLHLKNDFLVNLNETNEEELSITLHRTEETQRVIRILGKKQKNYPILIGEMGVGKKTVIKHLAYMCSKGEVPALKNSTVYSLDLSPLVTGATTRSELENNFKSIMLILKPADILFVNEVHLLAARNIPGMIEFTNLLRQHLVKLNVKIVSTATPSQYQELKKDPVLSSLFQDVEIQPLNREQTLDILKNIVATYQDYHLVNVQDECLSLITKLTDEYMKDRHFPNKAIDVLDEVCSLASLSSTKKNKPKLLEVSKKYKVFKKKYNTDNSTFDKDALKEINAQQLNDKLPIVNSSMIIKVIENITNTSISTNKLSKEENVRIKNIESNLKNELIGQDAALKVLARAIKRAKSVLRKKDRPTVLFFAGPTGVGKTESATVLAKHLFGSEELMIPLNMTEYMDSASISKLIGSPPGYVGFEQKGLLTEKVLKNPESVILLDEFEKADKKISHLFLQVFEKGELNDSKGNVIDFKKTIIILTSNIGVEKKNSVGFSKSSQADKTLDALEETYNREFINRLDEIITFNSLNESDLLKILDIRIGKYNEELLENGIKISVDEEVKLDLIKTAYSPTYGARPLRRVFREKIEDLVDDYWIDYNIRNEEIEGEEVEIENETNIKTLSIVKVNNRFEVS
ncbi:AAA family ATPase [Priestia aryabhattai]